MNNGDRSSGQSHPDQRLSFLLEHTLQTVSADAADVYVQHRETHQLEPDVALLDNISPPLLNWLQNEINQLTFTSPPTIKSFNDVSVSQPVSILLFPMTMYDMVIGCLVLICQTGRAYTDNDIRKLTTPAELIQTVLENQFLSERLITTEAIAQTSQAILQDPSPQNIVDVLRDYLFDDHIVTCTLSFYEPIPPGESRIQSVEVRGSWSKTMGSGVGVGMKFSVADQYIVLDILHDKKYFTHSDMDALRDQLPEFGIQLMNADRTQSTTLLALQSEEQWLGFLAISTDNPHGFSAHEIRTYQIVSEFLTVTMMAVALQREADFVQRSRAAILESVTDGVVMASPDEHSTVLTMNRQFSSLFRVDERLMLGKPLWELLEAMRIPASIKHDLKIAWGNAIEHGQGFVLGEFQMIGPQGNPLDLRWYTNPVHQGDQLIGRVFTFYDMTPERTAERLRTELLARLSHELRTPLTSIHGFAEMLTEFSDDDLSPAAAEYAHIIYKSATRLKDVFADLIEITRADTGEIRLYPSETYLPEIIEKVVDGLHNPIEQRRQTINIAIEDGLPAALVDLERIQRVVHILLNNAINHSPESGEIDLSIRYIRSSKHLPPSAPADTATPCIIVRIHDNGAGLSKEDVDRVFLPLYRTYASQSQKMDGAGLGLAIAHKYIELHGGNLWTTHATRKEPGGQFFFTVPVNDSAQA